MAEIAASAQEQSSGLSQVNAAVNQMDQMTQQNAAMVEESTAAAHSLAQETTSLSDLMGRFRIRDAAAPVRAPVRTPAARPAAPARTVVALKAVGGRGQSAAQSTDWEEF